MKEESTSGGECKQPTSADSTRRDAIKKIGLAAAVVAAPMVLPSRLLAQKTAKSDTPPPSERLSIAMIGLGTAMDNHRRSMSTNKDLFIHAGCDVDKRRVQSFQTSIMRSYRIDIVKYGKCLGTGDHREIMARDDIDGVVIATPPHWHAAIALDAIRSGKDVLIQTPLCLTVHEGQLIEAAAMQHGAMVQCIAPHRCEDQLIQLCELVRNGYIGDVKEVHVDLKYFDEPDVPVTSNAPKDLDFDRWLGPAPYVEHSSARVSGGRSTGWRRFWDYGLRTHGEQGFTSYDIIQWALGTENSGPVEFIPAGAGGSAYSTFRYENGPTVMIGHPVNNKQDVGFIGTQGDLSGSMRGQIKSDVEDLTRTKISSGDVRLRVDATSELAWVDSIKTRLKPNLDAAAAHRSTSIAQLMSIAERLGRAIKWDPAKQVIVGDESASRMLSRPRRAPYTLV